MERRSFLRALSATGTTALLIGLNRHASANTAVPNSLPAVAGDGVVSGDAVLAGLIGVYVFVDTIADDAAHDGLSFDDVQSHVKSRLLAASVKVATKDEWLKSQKIVQFAVEISTVKNDAGNYGFFVNVNTTEPVAILRGKMPTAVAITWSNAVIGTSSASEIGEQVINAVGQAVDGFTTAYNKQNPA
jgi:hypothetical protein